MTQVNGENVASEVLTIDFVENYFKSSFISENQQMICKFYIFEFTEMRVKLSFSKAQMTRSDEFTAEQC